MGTGKKEATRKERQGKTSDGLGNVKTKGENFYRYVRISLIMAVPFQNLSLSQMTEMRRRSRP